MRQITAIFLAIAITFANALCACAATAATRAAVQERVETRSCHAGKSSAPCHSTDGRSEQSRDSHDCAHCRGVASIATAMSASNADIPLYLAHFALPPSLEPFAIVEAKLNSIDHAGLSPPHRPASTLLALSCSSNT